MKRIIIYGVFALSSILACNPDDRPDGPMPPSFPGQEGGETGIGNYTPEIPVEENGYDGLMAADADADNIVAGNGTYWENMEFGTTVHITYSGGSADVSSSDDAVKSFVTGADVALDLSDVGPTEIIVSGSSDDGQLKVYGDACTKLTLDGLKLVSAKSAAINIQNNSTLYLHLADGKENVICDAKSQSDESYYPEGVVADEEKRNGALYCKGKTVISGTGVLKVTGKKKHGISVKSSITVRPGTTVVFNEVADNCVKAEGITVLGGYIWAKTAADAGKCLSSDADVIIKGGLMKFYTSGGSIYEADENDTSSPAGVKADGNMTVSGGEMLCVSTGEGGKGLNVDGNLTIDAGVINVVTSGGKYVYDESRDLDSSPKGVKADGEITINGGVLNIQVTGRSDGSEGLESKSRITVNGGDVFVYAYDDAINVGGDYPVGLEINGGRVFAFADNNDGIDSNGKLWINGGLVIASGSGAPEEGLDCDNSQNFIVKGGTVIGTGGAAISISNSSTQRAFIYNGLSARTGELFVICDSEGQPILKYELPRTINGMSVFFSSAEILPDHTYTIFSGGKIENNTVNWNGWFDDGSYSDGTELTTFTSNSLTTSIGQSNGPGGGPGNGGPGNGGWGHGWWH